MNRYEIRFGKWGAFFYDTQDAKDLTLHETCALLNERQITLVRIREYLKKLCWKRRDVDALIHTVTVPITCKYCSHRWTCYCPRRDAERKGINPTKDDETCYKYRSI